MKPLCFILMPFGTKKDKNGNEIDFNKIYEEFIKPSIVAASLEPIRADEEFVGGIIHKPMYERLMLCEYAVADLSILNPNVYYELGIRHAIRPHSTITIFEDTSALPFDTNFLRSLPYDKNLKDIDSLKKELTDKLLYAKEHQHIDSPLFQLVTGIQPSNIEHIKTDIFREQAIYSQEIKDKLFDARNDKSKEKLIAIEKELGDLETVESGVLIDLFLSYRDLKGYEEMIALVEKMPQPLCQTIMVQEQLGLALNRVGQQNRAIKVLEDIIQTHGKSSETNGILGRVYKDKYTKAIEDGNNTVAKGFLNKAIEIYLAGFESDFRDAYPGVNALTLMDIADDERFNEIYPVVIYAVKQKMKNSSDYWDYATLLELYVLKNDKENGTKILSDLLVYKRFDWELETTVNNLKAIKESREKKGIDTQYLDEIISLLK